MKHKTREIVKYTLLSSLVLLFVGFYYTTHKIEERKQMIKETTISGIVASNPILHSLISMVTKDVYVPKLIVDSKGDSLHEYSLKPSQIKLIQDADHLVMFSDKLEVFLADSVPVAKKIEVANSEKITLSTYLAHDMNTVLKKSSNKDALDYHFWLNPANAMSILDEIYNKVSELDKRNASKFERNLSEAKIELTKLSTQLKEIYSTIQGKKIVTYHQSLDYIERAYDVNIVGAIFVEEGEKGGSHSHGSNIYQGTKPSQIRYFEEVIDFMKKSKIDCVVKDDPKINSIDFAARVGARQTTINTIGSHLKPGPKLYQEAMLDIANNIAKCAIGEKEKAVEEGEENKDVKKTPKA